MKALVVGLLCLTLAPTPLTRKDPAPPLELRWLPELGRVSVTADGKRLEVAIESGGETRTQSIELDALPPSASIRTAKVDKWMSRGLVVVIAIQDGESTSYHGLFSSEARVRPQPYRSIELARPNPG